MRKFFFDDASALDATRTRFYSIEQLGDKQSLTPEGFLLCLDVPIARTGSQVYNEVEIRGIEGNADGVVEVTRHPEDVFRTESILSYAGKPFVNTHPDADVTPANWKKYAVGTVMNPRRGEGDHAHLLLADIMVTDPATIEDIRQNGIREVSCGYDADYEQAGPGKARQFNFIGNHVALVPQGRCGETCAIGDAQTVSTGDANMNIKTRDAKPKSMIQAVRDALKALIAKDEAGAVAALKEAEEAGMGDEGGAVNVHLHTGSDNPLSAGGPAGTETTDDDKWAENDKDHKEFRDDIAALKEKVGLGSEAKPAADAEEEEKEIEKESKGTGDKVRKARDSAYMEDSFRDTASMAEILMPGIRVPTFDAGMRPAKTLDAICALRKSALDLSNGTADGRALIESINGRALALDSMSCDQIRTLFRAAAAVKKAQNVDSLGTRSGVHTTAGQAVNGMSISDLNRRNAEFYAKNRA